MMLSTDHKTFPIAGGMAVAPPTHRLANPRPWLAAVLLVLLAGNLRFDGITRVGIRFDDESWYASDARLWHRCARVILSRSTIAAIAGGNKHSVREHMTEVGVDFNHRYRKPCLGYSFLAAGMMFLTGDHPNALPITNALLGTLSVLVLFGLTLLWFDGITAFGAALLLAVSPHHLLYCRSGLTETSAGFFILLGVLFWALGRQQRWPERRSWVFAGLALGIAITCHYRSAVVPVLLVFAEVFLLRKTPSETQASTPMRAALRRSLWLAGSVILPLVALEALFRVARFFATTNDGFFPVPTYFEAAWEYAVVLSGRWRMKSGALWNPDALPTYAAYIIHGHGVFAAVFLAVGLFVIAFKPGTAKWPAIFILTTVGLLALQRYTVARAISPALPFIAVCIAAGLSFTTQLVPLAKRALGPLVVLLMFAMSIPAIARSRELLQTNSGIEQACIFLTSQGEGAAALPMDTRKYTLYLEKAGIPIVQVEKNRMTDSPAEAIAYLRGHGVRWMVTDPQHWHCRRLTPPDYGVFSWWEAMESELHRSATLVAVFPHLTGFEREFLSEGWGLNFLDEMVEREGGAIRIYDLQSTLPPDERTTSVVEISSE